MYYATGGTHAPHHVPTEWADKYQGAFDQGWDALREQTFARQKDLGVVPDNAELTERPDEIPAWEDMPEELRPVLTRQMENYAGYLEQTDHHVGRVVQALDDLDLLDDTVVVYIVGDNGASGEGTLNGSFSEEIVMNGSDRDGNTGDAAGAARQVGRTGVLSALRGGLGPCDGHPVSVDQAGRVALGRHPQWHRRALARRDNSQR